MKTSCGSAKYLVEIVALRELLSCTNIEDAHERWLCMPERAYCGGHQRENQRFPVAG